VKVPLNLLMRKELVKTHLPRALSVREVALVLMVLAWSAAEVPGLII
jgi:hypothetical protein